METASTKASAMVVKDGELLASLDDGVLLTVDLHCEELAIVWYSLLAQAA
jgi:hypothetical protein